MVLVEPVSSEGQDLVLGQGVQIAVDVADDFGCDLGMAVLEVGLEAVLVIGLSGTVPDEKYLGGIRDLLDDVFEESRIVVIDVVPPMFLSLACALVLTDFARPIESFRIAAFVEPSSPNTSLVACDRHHHRRHAINVRIDTSDVSPLFYLSRITHCADAST